MSELGLESRSSDWEPSVSRSITKTPSPRPFSSSPSQSRQEIYACKSLFCPDQHMFACLMGIRLFRNCLKSVLRVYINNFLTWTCVTVTIIWNKRAISEAVVFVLRNVTHSRILAMHVLPCLNNQECATVIRLVREFCFFFSSFFFFCIPNTKKKKKTLIKYIKAKSSFVKLLSFSGNFYYLCHLFQELRWDMNLGIRIPCLYYNHVNFILQVQNQNTEIWA